MDRHMIGMWGASAQTFLIVLGGAIGVAFALPLLLMPLTWARAFRWNLPDDTDLAVYFGRCLGAVAVALASFALCAGLTGNGVVEIFQILLVIFTGLTIVHVWGAIQRIQPITETFEIGFWLALVLLVLMFYPA